MVLLQFRLDRFSFQDCFVVVRVVGRPAFELSVLFKQELECFADDVGRIRIKELCIPVQVIPDFLFQSDLQGCSFRLFRRRFQKSQDFVLLSVFVIHYRLHYKLRAPIPARGQNTATVPQ